MLQIVDYIDQLFQQCITTLKFSDYKQKIRQHNEVLLVQLKMPSQDSPASVNQVIPEFSPSNR